MINDSIAVSLTAFLINIMLDKKAFQSKPNVLCFDVCS